MPETRTKILSTSGMVDGGARRRRRAKVLVATETGMLHQLTKANPLVLFEPVNRAAVCKYMKMITPAKLLRSLREGIDVVDVPPDIAERARPLGRADDRHRHAVADGRVSVDRDLPATAAGCAPAPTWERDVDVVVLGSGAAGLAAALAVRPVRSVLVVTKDVLNAGSTAWAQGGLAGVLDPTDSLENHVRDTLAAGAGLCDEAVVRELVAEAPTAIRYLMRLGAAFDPRRRRATARR